MMRPSTRRRRSSTPRRALGEKLTLGGDHLPGEHPDLGEDALALSEEAGQVGGVRRRGSDPREMLEAEPDELFEPIEAGELAGVGHRRPNVGESGRDVADGGLIGNEEGGVPREEKASHPVLGVEECRVDGLDLRFELEGADDLR